MNLCIIQKAPIRIKNNGNLNEVGQDVFVFSSMTIPKKWKIKNEK